MTDQMIGLWSWFSEELADRLMFTMLHFLWQATVVAGLTWLVASSLKRAAPRTRYLV